MTETCCLDCDVDACIIDFNCRELRQKWCSGLEGDKKNCMGKCEWFISRGEVDAKRNSKVKR